MSDLSKSKQGHGMCLILGIIILYVYEKDTRIAISFRIALLAASSPAISR